MQVEAYAHEQGYPDVCLYSSVLHHFALEASQDELYSLSKHDQMQAIAETLDDVPELTLYERHQFCTAPVDTRKAQVFNAFLAFVERCAAMRCDASAHATDRGHSDLLCIGSGLMLYIVHAASDMLKSVRLHCDELRKRMQVCAAQECTTRGAFACGSALQSERVDVV